MASSCKILTPEGIIMLFISSLFDVAGWICAILVWVVGVGALAGQIVNVLGFITIGFWLFMRTGSLPSMKGMKGVKSILIIGVAVGVSLALNLPFGGFIILGGLNSVSKSDSGSSEEGVAGGLIKKFLKKQWKKVVIEVCPVLGDIYPGFILMVYSELK